MIEYPDEKQTSHMDEHWERLEWLDGRSIGISERGLQWNPNIPAGFVVNRKLPKGIEENITAPVIPFKVGGAGDVNSRQEARNATKEARERLRTSRVLFIALPNKEKHGYSIDDIWIHGVWSTGFVRISDLKTDDPASLLVESDQALDEGNEYLADSLTLAYEAIEWDKI